MWPLNDQTISQIPEEITRKIKELEANAIVTLCNVNIYRRLKYEYARSSTETIMCIHCFKDKNIDADWCLD